MLLPEQAKARLAEWRLPEAENRILNGVRQLPAELQSLAAAGFDFRPEFASESEADLWWATCRRAAVEIDRLPLGERAKIFGLVAPQLSPLLEIAWQLLKTTPYQAGYDRRAFRAPNHPYLTVDRRLSWLEDVALLCQRYPAELLTPAWLASWAAHLDEGHHRLSYSLGPVLAALLDQRTAEADEVFEILRLSLNNQHDIGGMGRHAYTALLLSSRAEGWELIEKLLLAAQRQEGLRQAILESVDETHPEAFRRMLRLILDEDLIRFSSVVRAVDVWFGQLWTAATAGAIKKMLGQVVAFLENPQARDKALGGRDAEAAFLALWCAATEDAVASVPLAAKLLGSRTVELRYVAARHLANLGLDVAVDALIPAIGDNDLRVATLALAWERWETSPDAPSKPRPADRFEQIERLASRVPSKPHKLPALVWPWTESTVKQSQVAAHLLHTRGHRPPTRLIPHLTKFEPNQRAAVVKQIAEFKPWDAPTRDALIALAGDASEDVREAAFESLRGVPLASAEVECLEDYLTRKVGDLRRGVLALLLAQSDADALASGRRLLAAKDANQRLAGLELLRHLAEAGRSEVDCRQLAGEYGGKAKKISPEEQSHLDEIAKENVPVATLDDALGLMNLAERTPVVKPQDRGATFVTPAAVACLSSLDALVHQYRETSIKCPSHSGAEREDLLGNIRWGFPHPQIDEPRDTQAAQLPLAAVWMQWDADRGPALRDDDGLELLRASIWSPFCDGWQAAAWREWADRSPEHQQLANRLSGGRPPLELRYAKLVGDLLRWLLFLHSGDAFRRDPLDYLLEALETLFAHIPAADMALLGESPKARLSRQHYLTAGADSDWRQIPAINAWCAALEVYSRLLGRPFNAEQVTRFWRLMHWRDEPFPGVRRQRVDPDLLFSAYALRSASLADIADQLLRPRTISHYRSEGFDLLAQLTDRKRHDEHAAWMRAHPEVQGLLDRAVARILELELSRGDAPTAATAPAQFLQSLWGSETLRRVLQALGKAEFKPGQRWRQFSIQDRRQTLTHLARITFPADGETPEMFARQMKIAVKGKQFPEVRLLQLMFLAPQWTKFIEAYFGWDQMSEGVYWFLAHMDVWGLTDNAAFAAGEEEPPASEPAADSAEPAADADSCEMKKLSPWERLVLERSPLTSAERSEGAIDIAWFHRSHELLGNERWQTLAVAARFAANPSQAKRAKFVADVLLNKVKRQELIDGIRKKQLKEHVRLLGLLPLAKGKRRDADLIERCKVLREYRRYANQLSGLTKPSALLAWEIGMKNLAQAAGYADPLRLEWAVGAEAVKDLAKGPVSAEKAGVTVTLTLDDLSQPNVTVCKGEKPLRAIPAAVKKDKRIVELLGRMTDLKRQAASIRQSLEAAMCRGDAFSGRELRTWCGHALLAPLLGRLVVVGEGILGYPDRQGHALRDFDGKLEPVKPDERLRLAHPCDLLKSGDWSHWQKECFAAERVQPFKQIFRELYVLTDQERRDGTISHRYDAQQVQPRQALALFGSRAWHTDDGIFKVFHDADLIATIRFQFGITTPLEVEDATLAGVSFASRGPWKPLLLTAVPPRIFSEVMRDIDLVVSVAHAGGVDPEASASTVEMRAGLLRETCALLRLSNVRFQPTHAIVDGQLAQYSVHLGSGTVHKLPGGALCIVPVHAQHRGRLFLPFADDDPRTAEVVSKVLLLARDHEIQDPTILEQIRA